MRILHIGYRLPPEPGGKERHIECLVREELALGHEVLVARRLGDVPAGALEVPLPRTLTARVVARRSDPLAFALECARALPRLGRVDVVNLHGDHREALAVGPAAARLGIPLVLTAHGALTTRHRMVMRWAFRRVGGFVALGTRPAADLRRAGVPARAIRTLSSGLDLPLLDAIRSRTAVEPGLIVSVGSLLPVKNHALTIAAFRRLSAIRPGLRLVIAGEGPERDRLERLAQAGPGVELAGHLPRDEVASLVSRAQVFVLASRRLPAIGEGVPTAALEALALGTPALLSSEATLDPVVTDHGAYRVFRSGSVDDLTAHLRVILDDDAVRAGMAERGRRATAHLGWPDVAARIVGWYEEVGRRAGLPSGRRSVARADGDGGGVRAVEAGARR
ncbi:glycosyltransferase family 4 protein [Microbispora hainanensis]|uniref:Glycosyltransferase family 4 protein n=1 Tax=Microbispora hainanensis TaxID=568844 RepID=A0ABZ1SY38_9ACTN|nr:MULTISPECIES: glycosyltransferase family 4 protein [Microbispora]NJP25070.1 glycosyltransferase family 4 protein [Microbispora sp. CL1-1]TQS13985.1 glycosyltransferase family 4 protein [Microbispora sp. SCL1-1]